MQHIAMQLELHHYQKKPTDDTFETA